MTGYRRVFVAVVVTAAALVVGGRAFGQGDSSTSSATPPKHAITIADETEKKVYEVIKAQAFRYSARDVASRAGADGFGELVGSFFSPVLEAHVWGYRYSGDTEWLDRFAAIADEMEKQLSKDPDGQLGWYSNFDMRKFGQKWPPDWPSSLVTAHQAGEARAAAALLEFALAVREEPSLRDKYGAKADGWAKLVETQLMPKWTGKYACLIGQSEDRAVFVWPFKAFKKSTMAWEEFPGIPNAESKDNLTLSHPDHSEIIREYLKAWQLTGKEDYRETACRLLRWQRSCLRPGKSGAVTWNFWDPASDNDFREVGGLAFGMYVHPDATPQARDAEAFVEAYHSGAIIDKGDIEHLINAQTKVMMTGQPDRIKWRNTAGIGTGMLWTPLVEFSPDLRTYWLANLDHRNFEFGSELRFFQERPYWDEWKRRRMGSGGTINWDKTYKDFDAEFKDLIKRHPPPDPKARKEIIRKQNEGAK